MHAFWASGAATASRCVPEIRAALHTEHAAMGIVEMERVSARRVTPARAASTHAWEACPTPAITTARAYRELTAHANVTSPGQVTHAQHAHQCTVARNAINFVPPHRAPHYPVTAKAHAPTVRVTVSRRLVALLARFQAPRAVFVKEDTSAAHAKGYAQAGHKTCAPIKDSATTAHSEPVNATVSTGFLWLTAPFHALEVR